MDTYRMSFLETIKAGQVLFLDGAMGTLLQEKGLPPGMPPEKFCLENPEILRDIHLAYLNAGANIITSCTFGSNRFKLSEGMDVYEINRNMVAIAKEAARQYGKENVFVAGDVGPTGLFAKPLGPVDPNEMIHVFTEQIKGLAAGGADFIFMETQFDLAELRSAIVACRQVCDLPIMASMTFEGGLSLTGSSPEIFAETMLNLGADIIGTNCSLGPVEMLPVIKGLLSSSAPHIMAEPNAGLPELREGKTVFPLNPENFAQKTAPFVEMGVQIIGGCCGTTPEHIKALHRAVKLKRVERHTHNPEGIVLTSRSRMVKIASNEPFALIGERINPTGKPRLAEELRKGEFDIALKMADEQIDAGARVIDINVGAPMVNEAEILPELASLLIARQLAPLSLDSSNIDALRAALPYAPGSALINSISGESGRMQIIGPLCKMFGAPFILLPLTGAVLPEKSSQRIEITEKLIAEAEGLGISRRLILVDLLALSVSSNEGAGRACLEFARWCGQNGLATTVGLSNISFGLPARELLNSAFLCLARGAGLNSCIANPSNRRIKEAVMAMSALMGYDPDCHNFINEFGEWKNDAQQVSQKAKTDKKAENVSEAVLTGDKEHVVQLLETELEAGSDPFKIVNDSLIPAINEVGDRYERKEYFLPQLIRSAETMQLAFANLKPHLEKKGHDVNKPVAVMATVEGDIHDIGKNIVSLLLGNHGFEVIDAGKNVPAEEIVRIAENNDAKIIGLSALMTTTMPRMEDTIKLLKKRKLPIKVMVGGAAVTPEFAESIGADAYSQDAVAAARVAKQLLATAN